MSVDPPVRPRPAVLRLLELDEYRFQDFATDFIAHELPDTDPTQYGRRGDAQSGIDLATASRGEKYGIQCKRLKEFGPADAQKAIDDTTYEADRYVILTACEVSAAVRDVIARHPKWALWDARDISRKVANLPREKAWLIVERHFGPAWAEEFVIGAPPAAPLEDAGTYFSFEGGARKLLRHDWATVGRDAEIAALEAVIADDSTRVALLLGRGGIGKTHLLAVVARRDREDGRTVRFLSRGDIDLRGLVGLLRPSDVVIVDDAHRREDLVAVLSGIRAVDRVKAILAIRPWCHAGTLGAVSKADFDASEIRDLSELRELDRDATRKLARQALGPAHGGEVDRLVAASWDSPLVTVVGGRLVADQEIDPALLDRHEDFRRAVFARFEADLVRPIVDRVGEANARRVLDFLAAVGPLRLENRQLVDAAATFLGTDAPTFVTAVGLMEEGGVLLRRGRLLRVTPDVLADHILHQACVTAAGTVTGYAERVFDAVADTTPGTILTNLAELDWRQRQTGGPDVFATIWERMLRRLAEARGWQRAELLKHLAEIAYFQPARLLELVEASLGEVRPHELPEDVRVALPKLLRGVSYSIKFLPRALDCLWVLGRDDERPTNQHYDHAMRVLEEIADYSLRKPLAVGWQVVEAVRRWLAAAESFGHKHSPLDVLDPLLKKSGHESVAEGATIHFNPFVLNERPLRELRDAAIAVLVELSKHPDVRVRLRVLQSVRGALSDPVGFFGQPITDEARAQWRSEQIRLLDLLEEMLGRDPLVDLRIRDAIDWHCRYRGPDEVRDRARAVAAAIPDREELRRTIVLTTYWDFDLLLPFDEATDGEDTSARIAEGNALMLQLEERVAGELVARFPDPARGAAAVSAELKRLADLGATVEAGQFLAVFSRAQTEYVARICDDIGASDAHELSGYFAALIAGVVEKDPSRAITVAWKAQAARNEFALASLAAAIGTGRWREAPGLWDLATALAAYPSANVRHRLVMAVYGLRELDADKSTRLLMSMDFGRDEHLANAILGLIGEKRIPLTAVTDAELDDVLRRLEELDAVEEFWIREFIGAAARRRPRSVANMFIRRTALAATRGPEYRPVPWDHDRPDLDALEGADGYADLLRGIRDEMVGGAGRERWRTVELFGSLSAGFGPTSLRVLNEWIETGDSERIIAAATLLKDAPWQFVFGEEAFVARLLEKASHAGEDCYRRVGGALISIVSSGLVEGTPGQPAPRHIAQRDNAAGAASRYPEGSPVRRFYEAVRDDAMRQIEDERIRDAEEFGV